MLWAESSCCCCCASFCRCRRCCCCFVVVLCCANGDCNIAETKRGVCRRLSTVEEWNYAASRFFWLDKLFWCSGGSATILHMYTRRPAHLSNATCALKLRTLDFYRSAKESTTSTNHALSLSIIQRNTNIPRIINTRTLCTHCEVDKNLQTPNNFRPRTVLLSTIRLWPYLITGWSPPQRKGDSDWRRLAIFEFLEKPEHKKTARIDRKKNMKTLDSLFSGGGRRVLRHDWQHHPIRPCCCQLSSAARLTYCL